MQAILEKGLLDRTARVEIGNILLSEMQENFRVGGRPTPWKTSLRVERFGGQTLLRSGHLMKSLTAAVDGEDVAIGSNLIYARIHALGGIIRAKNAEYLMFRVPSGLRTTSKAGKTLKKPQQQFAFVRVKQVTIPQRDYRYISPQGAGFVASAALRSLMTQ
jgi:phage gpG-like protein